MNELSLEIARKAAEIGYDSAVMGLSLAGAMTCAEVMARQMIDDSTPSAVAVFNADSINTPIATVVAPSNEQLGFVFTSCARGG